MSSNHLKTTDSSNIKSSPDPSWLQSLVIWILSVPIWLYRYGVSPLFLPSCRYSPTCSAYALEALMMHGPVRGLWLTLCRIGRCTPWGETGYDPVPPKIQKK